MGEKISVEIYGYASARSEIDVGEWEAMSRREKEEWASSQIKKHGRVEGHEVSEVQAETGETITF